MLNVVFPPIFFALYFELEFGVSHYNGSLTSTPLSDLVSPFS